MQLEMVPKRYGQGIYRCTSARETWTLKRETIILGLNEVHGSYQH
jgi:hypothetical protein